MSAIKQLSSLVNWFGDTFIIDIETTGIVVTVDNIIEIGVLKLDKKTGDVEKELNMLIKLPDGKKISREITELTGITDNMLTDFGIAPEEAIKQLSAFVWNGEYDPTIIAHNAQFDLSFLSVFLNDNGYSDLCHSFHVLDTLTVLKDRKKYPHKLSDAVQYYKVETISTHRAIDDCRALFEVLCKMNQEKDDLCAYRDLIGYNPKYGVANDVPVGEARYLPQIFDYKRPLYEQTEFDGYVLKSPRRRENNVFIATKDNQFGFCEFNYFNECKIRWMLPLEYDNIFPLGWTDLVLYKNNKQGLCDISSVANVLEEDGEVLFKTECVYDYIEYRSGGYILKNEDGVQYYENGNITPVYKSIIVFFNYCIAYDGKSSVILSRKYGEDFTLIDHDTQADLIEPIENDLFFVLYRCEREQRKDGQLYKRVGNKLEVLPYIFEYEFRAEKNYGVDHIEAGTFTIVKSENGYGILGKGGEVMLEAIYDEVAVESKVNLLLRGNKTTVNLPILPFLELNEES